MAEDLAALAAIGAEEIAHVLDDAEHRHVDLAEHVEALARVDQRDVLRRRDDHGAGERHLLRHGELRVAGAGRHVDHQDVELAPLRRRAASAASALITIGPRQIIGVSSATMKPIDIALRP